MRALLLAAAAAAPATALGAGFPAPGMDTSRTGATAPGDPYRYSAIPQPGGRTLVVKVLRDGGRIVRHRALRGTSVVAAAALDGATTGLSADGSRLVLIGPRRARRQHVTRLVVLGTATLRPIRRLVLRGDFTLDAVSPDGRRLFLVRFPDAAANPLDYAVRAYDVERRRLLARPLVDPRNPDEKMTGMPLTRVLSPDGRWAYTLYAGGEEQFVHALDTARSRAYCVDLPAVTSEDAGMARLVARRGAVDLVGQSGSVLGRIDTATLRVSTPRPAAKPAPELAPGRGPQDRFPWALAAAVAAIGAAALLVLRRRYAAGTDSAASRSASSSRSSVP
ncbi:MAG TPA: hypothetical protein VFL73_08020 [Solirubrobacteraceae bacterium]|nr:hypothetical protein [Solirubrobacteraceae bacterium]